MQPPTITISAITIQSWATKNYTLNCTNRTAGMCAVSDSMERRLAWGERGLHIYSDTHNRAPLEVTLWSLWVSINEDVTIDIGMVVTRHIQCLSNIQI